MRIEPMKEIEIEIENPYFYFTGIRVSPTACWQFSTSNAPLFIIQRNM